MSQQFFDPHTPEDQLTPFGSVGETVSVNLNGFRYPAIIVHVHANGLCDVVVYMAWRLGQAAPEAPYVPVVSETRTLHGISFSNTGMEGFYSRQPWTLPAVSPF